MADEVKQPQEEDIKKKKFEVSYAIVSVVAGVMISIIIGAFNYGGCAAREMDKVEWAKKEQKHIEEITLIKSTLGREKQEATDEMTYYKNRYLSTLRKLDACIAKREGEYVYPADSEKINK